jgi:hypothetical protein
VSSFADRVQSILEGASEMAPYFLY